jgi:hypothetical protein
LTFFGLTPEYRLSLFKQIHEIVFNGQGGYQWETVYDMPIWLRRFTFETLREYYEKRNKDKETLEDSVKGKDKNKPTRPDIAPKPTYTTKAPTKK